MASPNFNTLVVRLSRWINDPVTAAGTDGQIHSSAKRVLWVNEGCRNWMRNIVAVNLARRDKGLAEDWSRLRGYITQTTGTINASIKIATSSMTPVPFHIVSLWNTTDSVDIQPIPAEMTRTDIQYKTNSIRMNQYYEWDASDLYVVGGASTDGYAMEYVGQHTDLTVDNATDILINSAYWDEVLKEAYKVYLLEYPTQDNRAIYLSLVNS